MNQEPPQTTRDSQRQPETTRETRGTRGSQGQPGEPDELGATIDNQRQPGEPGAARGNQENRGNQDNQENQGQPGKPFGETSRASDNQGDFLFSMSSPSPHPPYGVVFLFRLFPPPPTDQFLPPLYCIQYMYTMCGLGKYVEWKKRFHSQPKPARFIQPKYVHNSMSEHSAML